MTKPKPLKRPDSIRIFGRTYSITYVPAADPTFPSLGLTDADSHRIWCADGQPAVEEADTVVHEIFHAIRATMRAEVDPAVEETMVGILATGIVGVLQDNPEFAKWLIEGRNK